MRQILVLDRLQRITVVSKRVVAEQRQCSRNRIPGTADATNVCRVDQLIFTLLIVARNLNRRR